MHLSVKRAALAGAATARKFVISLRRLQTENILSNTYVNDCKWELAICNHTRIFRGDALGCIAIRGGVPQWEPQAVSTMVWFP